MPDGHRRARRAALSRRFLSGVAVGLALAAIAVGVVVLISNSPTKPARPPSPPAPGIDMSRASGVACGTPVAPGAGHPNTLLSEVFNVHDATGTAYVVGWQIDPFRGTRRTYRFGIPGDILALEPATGGPPLGFGTGTVTFRASSEAGTVDAVIKLKTGRSLTVWGSWHCVVAATSIPPTTTTPLPTNSVN